MNSHFLYPGHLIVAEHPARLTTLLGSCVAVALYDTQTKRVGLNHYLLPRPGSEETPNSRYGTYAVEELYKRMLAAGSQPQDLVAKVYGGANVLNKVMIGQKIGEANIQIALDELKRLRVQIQEKNISGQQGRKVIVHSDGFKIDHSFSGEPSSDKSTSEKTFDTSGFQGLPEARDVSVLIVDDSATVRSIFQKIFAKAGLKVVGVASNAYEAREILAREKPSVITLDIEMPQMNGVRFLEKLMQHFPIPVVMVSSLGSQGDAALESLRLGAIEFVQKPSQFDPSVLRDLAESLVSKVRAAASRRVSPIRPGASGVVSAGASGASLSGGAEAGGAGAAGGASSSTRFTGSRMTSGASGGLVRGVFVSGNTGAPKSLVDLFSNSTGDVPPMVLSVSTIGPFLSNFIADLKKKTGVILRPAVDGMPLNPGTASFIPAETHGVIEMQGRDPVIRLVKGPPVAGQIPSGDRLLESAARVLGSSAVGILLSGFGSDGVQGLSQIHSAGGMTMVENPDDAGFPFIPQSAISLGVVHHVVSVGQIFNILMEHRNKQAA